MFHRRHGYGRWLDVLEDAQLSLQPVIRAELLLRKVDDGSSFAQNGDAHHSSNDVENGSGKGMRFQITTFLVIEVKLQLITKLGCYTVGLFED